VDARATFGPHIQAAELMESRQRAFDDPARPPEATAMTGPAFRQLSLDPSALERVAVGLRIIPAVTLHQVGLSPGPLAAVSRAASGIPRASVRM
jgi:hypothetical protein